MKLLSMHGAFHPKSDIDRLYLPKGIKARVKRIGIPVKVEAGCRQLVLMETRFI